MKKNPKQECFELPLGAVLRVSGEDAAAFLQGQFTNELQKDSGACAYGLWLNQKGKVIADSHVLQLGRDEFWVISERCGATVIKERLEQFIIADDVKVIDETANYRAVMVWDTQPALLAGLFEGAVPPAGRFIGGEAGLVFAYRSSLTGVYVLVGSLQRMDEWRGFLRAAGYGWLDAMAVDYWRIVSGVPAVPHDIGSGDLPNEGGLEQSAISYTKGCYLGQEVMARLKNLGQVRRRLHIVQGSGVPPAALTALYQGETKVGEIRSTAAGGEGWVAWAMLSLVTFKPEAGLQLAPAAPVGVQLYSHG